MELGLVIASVVAALGALLLYRSVRVVPQSKAHIVERFGRHHRTLTAGLSMVIPFADQIYYRVDLREQVIAFPPQPVTTSDNVVVNTETVVYFQVVDPTAAVYEVANHVAALEQLTIVTLRKIGGAMDLQRMLSSREDIDVRLRDVLDQAGGKWGVQVNRAELKALDPPAAIQSASERLLSAQIDQRAATMRSEADRRAKMLLDGRREPRGDDVQRGEVTAGTPLRIGDPERVGPYRLIERLGMGGQGVVYLGENDSNERVAVKVLRDELAAESQVLERFARELSAARRVTPFCIAQVVDADLSANPPYIASEYVTGLSLQQTVAQTGARQGPALHRLAVATAAALAAIHEAGVVHRDLKPGNVLLGPDGPRVIDFGIARAFEEATSTLTIGAIGTPAYMAPEQVSEKRVEPAADVFAWGCVMVYAATGRPPFGTDRIPAIFHRILHEPPDLGDLASPLRELVDSCLSKDPERRPSAQDLLLRLLGRRTETAGTTAATKVGDLIESAGEDLRDRL
ncbi:protein kinase domain-containing protein [Actinomadura alba]|uniref:Protein kinase n=1 Tax=Actinomadura alba TaxID=406431 RepID=A0ABR7M0G1_9ACTN|nr:SPFH domain-containing protein [Actinomadura alba]MBC6470596.1 protein kinase [Actinomadura alba]